jgi:hypothetical protein
MYVLISFSVCFIHISQYEFLLKPLRRHWCCYKDTHIYMDKYLYTKRSAVHLLVKSTE